MIKKKMRKHNKIILLPKPKLNSRDVFISKVLIDLCISNNEFVLVNNVLKEYDDMKKGTKNLNNR